MSAGAREGEGRFVSMASRPMGEGGGGKAAGDLGPSAGPLARLRAWKALCRAAGVCRACGGMDGARPVLSDRNGPVGARVLFVGEAPGRRGADRTRVPFLGDASGDCFDRLLRSAGLSRGQVVVTNAVLCCPRREGSNRRPTSQEIANCGRFLRDTIEVVQPAVVATLGRVALEAVWRVCGCGGPGSSWSHPARRGPTDGPPRLADAVGRIIRCPGFVLVPLYHPSPRVLHAFRHMEQQERDIRAVAKALALVSRRRYVAFA